MMQAQSGWDRPRFRQDLVAEAVEDGGQKFIDVGDPDSGSVFRFYEVEFSIACGMDGERDVAGIVQWAKDELGLMPSVNEVRNVISTLGQYGFLDQAGAARAAATERPTPTAARETELAPGVVVGQQKKPAASIDVELGDAGARAAAASPMPKSADIDLGAPGAVAGAKAPKIPVEDVALGAPGARAVKSDVSLDLADHMGVKPDDVKEAVRQSKQMAAVEVPKDLMEQLEAPVPPPKAVEAPKPVAAKVEAKPVEAKPVEAKPAEKKPVEAKPAEKKPVEAKPVEAKPAEKKPAEKKPAEKKPAEKQVVAEKKQPIPQAPRSGVSPVLIILLVLAVGGAGAYFAWRYLIRDKAAPAAEVKPPVSPEVGSAGSAPVVPPQPPKPPPAMAKFATLPGLERDILTMFAGAIEQIDTTERDVDSSEILVRLAGAKRLEAELATMQKDIDKKTEALKKARDAREKLSAPPAEGSAAKPPTEAQLAAADAAIQKAEQALEAKHEEKQKKEDELEKKLVRAPFEGKVTFLVKQGQKLEEDVAVAKITPKPAPTATFKLHKNMTLDRGLTIPVKIGETLHTCLITDSTVDGTRVVCGQPESANIAEGTEGQLMVEQE